MTWLWVVGVVAVLLATLGLVQLGWWLVGEPYWFLKDEDE